MSVTMPKTARAASAPKCVSVSKVGASSRAFFGNKVSAKTLTAKARPMTKIMAASKDGEKIAEGYASALAEVASKANSLEAVHSDMETLDAVLSDELMTFFANPVLPNEKKKDIIIKICKEAEFTTYTTNFLKLLVDKQRIDTVGSMINAFEAIYCKLTNTEVATVTSAVKLENEQQFLIAKKLQELTGAKNIKLKPTIDESVLGGFVVRYGENGSQLVDQSVKGKLDKITAAMTMA
jgi:F-type H+-transporting ATPase subunit delta